MKEWDITQAVIALGHKLRDQKYRFRCSACHRTIRDILEGQIKCDGT